MDRAEPERVVRDTGARVLAAGRAMLAGTQPQATAALAQPAAADPPAAAQGAVLDTHTGPLADRGIVVAFDYDNKTGATRLGFALALKFLLWRGRFPRGHHELPDDAVEHVVRQVGVPAEKSQC